MAQNLHESLHALILRMRFQRWAVRQLQRCACPFCQHYLIGLSMCLTCWRPTWGEAQVLENRR